MWAWQSVRASWPEECTRRKFCRSLRSTAAMRQRAVPGYCGKHRATDVTAEGPSCVSTYGRWYTPGTRPSLQECVRRCTACDACRFVSFSAQTVDCSLYAACDVTQLKKGHGYMTLDVRQSSQPGSYSRHIASDRLPAAKVAQHRQCYATLLYQDLNTTLKRRPWEYDIGMARLWASRMLNATRVPIFVMHAVVDPRAVLGPLLDCRSDARGGQIHLREVPLILGPTRLDWLHYRYQYTKLHAWALPCQQVVYLDYDLVPLRSPDSLFELCGSRALCGTQDVTTPKSKNFRVINGGLLVLRPNRTLYRTLVRKAAWEVRRHVVRLLVEQGFLKYHGPPWHELPPGYNLPQYYGWDFWPRAPEADAIAMLMRNTSVMAHLKLSEMRGGVATILGCRYQWAHSICLKLRSQSSGTCREYSPAAREAKALGEAMRVAGC